MLPRRGPQRPGRAAGRRPDPLRRADGRQRRHPRAPARRQRGDLHPARPPRTELARRLDTTRSAAAIQLWGQRLDGAVVAIGNAPTALFHLLEHLRATPWRPAAILGIPVGFIGAAESKRALADNDLGLEYIVVHGRRGGSAITCGALNAIASTAE